MPYLDPDISVIATLLLVVRHVRIPEHPAGHSDNIRRPKPGHPATFGVPC
jgi:hypothetical protein